MSITPPILHACSDSRMEGLRSYELVGGNIEPGEIARPRRNGMGNIQYSHNVVKPYFIIPEIEILYVSDHMSARQFQMLLREDEHDTNWANISTIAATYEKLQQLDLHSFAALHKVIILRGHATLTNHHCSNPLGGDLCFGALISEGQRQQDNNASAAKYREQRFRDDWRESTSLMDIKAGEMIPECPGIELMCFCKEPSRSRSLSNENIREFLNRTGQGRLRPR